MFRVGRRPAGKRVRQKLIQIREELFSRIHWDKEKLAKCLGKVIAGWLNFYAVSGTSKILEAFCFAVERYLLRALRRRSQFDHTKWTTVDGLAKCFW
ncbi:MAG: group II intron reverse transcriptase/maturase, partial [Gammaproteobacteria bacterium]|nr:group II intron reverse transcriptase/maturase [Gammaproteobacteria bacterium]